MSIKPLFKIGLWNAWLFMIVFLLQWLAVLVVPGHTAKRTGHPAALKQNRKERMTGRITETFWIGAVLYSLFLPFNTGTAWFYAGLAAFVTGLIILVWATVIAIRTPLNRPFTRGIYRFSRHPMYLSMMFIYTGVTLAAASWLFALITVITFFLQRLQVIREESYCAAQFGRVYLEYRKKTPRWIGLPKSS